MIPSALARTARRISRSSNWRRSAPCPTSTSSAPPTRSNAPNAGRSRSAPRRRRRSWRSPARALPLLRTAHTDENLTAKGAYVLVEPKGRRDVTLIATGSEVALAVTAAKALGKARGSRRRVVSMPCWELFEARIEAYQDAVLGAAPRVGVEAAVEFGWREMARILRQIRRHAWIWGFCSGRGAL